MWRALECIMLNEISQTEKNKYVMLLHICGILKKLNIQRNIIKQKQTHRLTDIENKLVVNSVEREGGGARI